MIITYHNIGKYKGFNTVAFDAFKSQIDYLKKHYRIVDIDHYVDNIIQNGKNSPNEVLLTFDDAYTSFIDPVMPFLEKQKIPVALFVCNNYIGKSNEWDVPENRIEILNESQLQLLSTNTLVTIGAHSLTHRSLLSLTDLELKEELIYSKQYLEGLIKQPVKYLAYPYGQYYINVNSKVYKIAQEAGYRGALTSNFNNRNQLNELFALNRLDITGNDSLSVFQKKLTFYNYYYFKQRMKNCCSLLNQWLPKV